jgi:hypothetical protein
MIYTGYLDFWFTDLPLIERVEKFFELGIDRYDVWCWRQVAMADLAAESSKLAPGLIQPLMTPWVPWPTPVIMN